MPEASKSAEFTFKIHPAGGGMEVPVSLLTQSLTTLQELVQLFALMEEGRTLRERLRLPDELKKKYILRCRPPATGSFAVSGRVSSTASDLFADEQTGRVMTNLQEFGVAAVARNQPRLLELVPDSRLRHRILSRFVTLSPPPGSGYRYGSPCSAARDIDEEQRNGNESEGGCVCMRVRCSRRTGRNTAQSA